MSWRASALLLGDAPINLGQPEPPPPVGGYPTNTPVTYATGNLVSSDESALGDIGYGSGITKAQVSTVLGVNCSWLDSRGIDYMSYAASPAEGFPYLECEHVPQSNGTERIGWNADLPSGLIDAWCRYDAYFVDQPGGAPFIFSGATSGTSGGKMHGFYGGSLSTTDGGSGGGTAQTGWSIRVPWKYQGRPQVYFYHPDKPGEFGDALYFVKEVGNDNSTYYYPTSQWFRTIINVKMNTGSSSFNGSFDVWTDHFDGAGPILRARKTGLRWWVNTSARHIDHLYFSCFYGGGSADWAPSETTHTRHRDFHVTDTPMIT